MDGSNSDLADPLSVDEEDNSDIVILEVSSVGGRQLTKLIEPPAKKKKIECQEESVSFATRESKVQAGSDPMEMGVRTKSVLTPDDPSPVNGMPIMVKEGNTSRLMYLYSSPQTSLHEAQLPPVTKINSSQVRRSNNDMLIERLEIRIKELEAKLSEQRDAFKSKMSKAEEKHRRKTELLNRTIDQLKAQTPKSAPPVRIPKTARPDPPKTCNCGGNQPIHQEVFYSVLKDRFSRNQIKAMIEKDTMIRWDDSELLKAYTLRCISYGAYIFLRDQLKYPLPSMKYLTRWLGKHQSKKEVHSLEGDSSSDDKTGVAELGKLDQVSAEEVLLAEEGQWSQGERSKQLSTVKCEASTENVDLIIADESLDESGVIERYILVTPRDDSSPNRNSGPKFVRAVSAKSEEFHYLASGDSKNFIEEVYIVKENDDDADRIESEHCYQSSAQEEFIEH